MAVGETSGQARDTGGRVISSAARKRAAESQAPAEEVDDTEHAPLVKEADPEFERLLAEEEEIERSTQAHSETPHFRPGDGD
jgi:small subunit ribosomal protein S3